MVYKDQDIVKHGKNLPGYLQFGGSTANNQDKAYNFGVLDWDHLENWKLNRKGLVKTSLSGIDTTRINTSTNNSDGKHAERMTSEREAYSLDATRNLHSASKILSEKNIDHEEDVHRLSDSRKSCDGNLKGVNERRLSSSFLEDDLNSVNPSKEVQLLSNFHSFRSKKRNANNIFRFIPMKQLINPLLKHKGRYLAEKIHQLNRNLISSHIDEKQISSDVQSILHLTMKNGIPLFKLVADSNSGNILVAAVQKLPSGKDDSSLTYTFHSVNEIKKSSKGWKNQDSIEKGHCFDHDIVGHMKISSSYHAEFSGLERDLFVVRESVLYGPDYMLTGELAAIIVKNISRENHGGIGDSKSTVVILPGGSHTVPNSGQPSSLINRWKSGGVCDCGGWDIGCELGVLTNQNESTEISSPTTLDRLDLYYQGRHNNKHEFSLVLLENGLYSLEYNASITLLQAFSICVAIVSSQDLTHMFQVNHLQDVNGFTKPVIARHEKVKSQTLVHATMPPVSPPVSPIERL